jgi:ABC-type Fe3+/spermidine/putrescine transport system ATPase subunit
MTTVNIRSLTRKFGTMVAVDDVNLEIASGEMIALLGPSGCGKTTTLRMLSGLLNPTEGDITFDGSSIVDVPTEKRGAVMVFQKHLLFPTMTVAENVGFGLRMARKSKAEVASTTKEMLERVQLADLGERKAHELSGGQQQRVALARALAVRPKVLLLDEPLANLDANLRVDMREQIRDVQVEMGITAIFVTHDQEEAVMLADRVALMKAGRLLQVGAPEDFYQRPATAEVSGFFRNTNLLAGVLAGNRVKTDVGELTVNADELDVPDGDVLITVRPEAVEVGPGENSVDGLVKTAIYMGTHTHLQVDVGGKMWDVHSRVDDRVAVGDAIELRLPPDGIWALPVAEAEDIMTPAAPE